MNASVTASAGDAGARPRPRRRLIVRLHRWLGLASAIFWLIQAITGLLLSFHFEIEDALVTQGHQPTDLTAIERRLDSLAPEGSGRSVSFIWTSAGLPDRYVISLAEAGGPGRMLRIEGDGTVVRDAAANDFSFLALMREIHLNLLSGSAGTWILSITGALLVTNLIFGLIAAWPRPGCWGQALKPVQRGGAKARLFSWHRAVGLWAALPAIVIAGSGTLILFEHELQDLLGVSEIELPANPPQGPGIGFAQAARAAAAAIPGSSFVGTTMPTEADASYHAWVRAPGELYRAYGGSLVIVNANDGSVRGAWPITEANTRRAFLGALYPIHTGEAAGLVGRVLTFALGLWLAVMIVTGAWLWWRRRPRSGRT
jgi:uncharacterized iron-regulated membrane protein